MSLNIELVIFDMDGLMFDTERIGHLAWERIAAKYQFPYSLDITKKFIGRNHDAIISVLKDTYGENAPVEFWHSESWEERKNIFKENGTLGLKPGLIEILTFLKELNIKMAVASSSGRSDIIQHLQHEGLEHYFDFVIGGDQVKESKPKPEIFLRPCETFGILPKNALVIEDSYNGFLAARAAGIPVIIVPDLVEPREDVLREAEGVFPSLHEVKAYIEESFCLVK